MRICKSQTGYALALLMWMIAGMSLLVMAVIHFAQDDIGLAEQRLNEAKSDALARGVAMLALRDEALAPYLDEAKPDGDGSTGRNSGNRTTTNASMALYPHGGTSWTVMLLLRPCIPPLGSCRSMAPLAMNWVGFLPSWVERQDQKWMRLCRV